MQNENKCFDWDDAIENDGEGFTLLPKGEYPFRVTKFERSHFKGSTILPPCNAAIVTFDVGDAEISASLTERFFLVQSCEWKLSGYFLVPVVCRGPLEYDFEVV